MYLWFLGGLEVQLGRRAAILNNSRGNTLLGVRASYLKSIVCLYEEVPATDAAVDTAQGQEDTEGEEVTVVQMSHTVVQPGCVTKIKENHLCVS